MWQKQAGDKRVMRIVQSLHVASDPVEVFRRVPGMGAPVVAADCEHSRSRLLQQRGREYASWSVWVGMALSAALPEREAVQLDEQSVEREQPPERLALQLVHLTCVVEEHFGLVEREAQVRPLRPLDVLCARDQLALECDQLSVFSDRRPRHAPRSARAGAPRQTRAVSRASLRAFARSASTGTGTGRSAHAAAATRRANTSRATAQRVHYRH